MSIAQTLQALRAEQWRDSNDDSQIVANLYQDALDDSYELDSWDDQDDEIFN